MSDIQEENKQALAKITKDRSRTNLLRNSEQRLLAYLVQRIPRWVSSDMLTAIGFIGSIITCAGFILGAFVHTSLLLVGIAGFAINWFGDSLDGRVAYYRNTPRKWYGFSLDIVVDWLTDILIGFGFILYVSGHWKWVGFAFVVMYGWAMIIALLRYKITDKYTIDTNLMGPTEVRILISLFMVIEIIVPNTIQYMGLAACIVLLYVNLSDMGKLLKMGDQRDKEERKNKEQSTSV